MKILVKTIIGKSQPVELTLPDRYEIIVMSHLSLLIEKSCVYHSDGLTIISFSNEKILVEFDKSADLDRFIEILNSCLT